MSVSFVLYYCLASPGLVVSNILVSTYTDTPVARTPVVLAVCIWSFTE